MKTTNLMNFESTVDAKIAVSMTEVMDAIKYFELTGEQKSTAIKYWVDHRND